jgi:hypothetical protein
MKVRVRTTTGLGATYNFDVDPSMTIEQLKEYAAVKVGYRDPEILWLVFDGEILYDDATLDDYDIKADSELELVDRTNSYRGFGGLIGLKFVDVSDDQALKRIGWSTTAPRWRRARHGLCLEGLCINNKCEAFNRTVIMPVGYKTLDMLSDSIDKTTKCPACKEYVTPVTCGFNNCWWKYDGLQKFKSGPSKPCSSGWRQADDAYHRFNEHQGDDFTWKKLIFEVVKTRPTEIPATAPTNATANTRTNTTTSRPAAGQFGYSDLT